MASASGRPPPAPRVESDNFAAVSILPNVKPWGNSPELLPTAHRYDPEDTVVTPFTLLGMAIMSSSLVLFLY